MALAARLVDAGDDTALASASHREAHRANGQFTPSVFGPARRSLHHEIGAEALHGQAWDGRATREVGQRCIIGEEQRMRVGEAYAVSWQGQVPPTGRASAGSAM